MLMPSLPLPPKPEMTRPRAGQRKPRPTGWTEAVGATLPV
jgi:hypothetical protein